MTKQTLVIKLTTEPFDLDTLPSAQNRTVVPIAHEPETCTLPYLNAMTLLLLEHVAKTLSVLDNVYIIMKPSAHSISVALMLWTAFSQVSIEPSIWIVQRQGVFISTKEFIAAGTDWAYRVRQGWKEQAALEALTSGDVLREKDGTPE